ncbi:8730_t:CDS:2 [Funneliformis caledonium]|uniref:8730_t:CDS:1 n=1 Tax=Funneliformis caledonium TaxID=1117310 RepID=A0A9N9AU08_9GLOM|nr:8730_t:CDS:2 [Funneliformis caledonium]
MIIPNSSTAFTALLVNVSLDNPTTTPIIGQGSFDNVPNHFSDYGFTLPHKSFAIHMPAHIDPLITLAPVKIINEKLSNCVNIIKNQEHSQLFFCGYEATYRVSKSRTPGLYEKIILQEGHYDTDYPAWLLEEHLAQL